MGQSLILSLLYRYPLNVVLLLSFLYGLIFVCKQTPLQLSCITKDYYKKRGRGEGKTRLGPKLRTGISARSIIAIRPGTEAG